MKTDYQTLSLRIDRGASGIYLAYPTSPVMARTYKDHHTWVNHEHTKIGRASRFILRENSYIKTFQGEVEFFRLVELPVEKLGLAEAMLKLELSKRYARSGRASEWFATRDRDAIADIVWRVARTVSRTTPEEAMEAVQAPSSTRL